jgi:hypothetical protein
VVFFFGATPRFTPVAAATPTLVTRAARHIAMSLPILPVI